MGFERFSGTKSSSHWTVTRGAGPVTDVRAATPDDVGHGGHVPLWNATFADAGPGPGRRGR